MTKKYLDELSFKIIGAAIEVHKALGPGLLESVYHKCMMTELKEKKMTYVSEINVPVTYKGTELETLLRCDFLIENCIALELKSVDAVTPVFEAQVLTYMKLLNAPKGILINFTAPIFLKKDKEHL